MRLHLDHLGMIPASYPKTFYRVETWSGGHYGIDTMTVVRDRFGREWCHDAAGNRRMNDWL